MVYKVAKPLRGRTSGRVRKPMESKNNDGKSHQLYQSKIIHFWGLLMRFCCSSTKSSAFVLLFFRAYLRLRRSLASTLKEKRPINYLFIWRGYNLLNKN